MKCELCHKAEAQTAIERGEGDEAEELYVCKACAKAERQKRQNQSQHTHRVIEVNGERIDEDEITDEDGEELTPFDTITRAFRHLADGLDRVADGILKHEEAKRKRVYTEFPLTRVASAYRLGNRLHLEGLSILGDIDQVVRAAGALRMKLVGINADGIHDTGHVYSLEYSGSAEQAKRVVTDIITQERNARRYLLDKMPRVYGDTLCRALAMLKNCRTVTAGELFDMLSPVRLGARDGFIEGITAAGIERIMRRLKLGAEEEEPLDGAELDRIDADRADWANEIFRNVMLNERGEKRFL